LSERRIYPSIVITKQARSSFLESFLRETYDKMATAQVETYRPQSLDHSLTTPPITPPNSVDPKKSHPWPEPETVPEEIWDFPSKRRKLVDGSSTVVKSEVFNVQHQEVLLLHGVKQKYEHTKEQPVPNLNNDREMLVAVEVIGLNPIDWKAPYVICQF